MMDSSTLVRPMCEADLQGIVELDAGSIGMRRKDFFDKRWRAMGQAPADHIACVAERDGALAGFVMAHILSGEFGADRRYAILDGLGVDTTRRGSGTGTALLEALKNEARARGCEELRTQVSWSNRELVSFLAGAGFDPAAVNVLERLLEDERHESDR